MVLEGFFVWVDMKMMINVLKKSVGTALLLGCLSLGITPSLKAMSLGMNGLLIQATPYDDKMSQAGVLANYLPTSPVESMEGLFTKARTIRYTPDEQNLDHWQSPEETQSRWAGDCEDKAIWLYTQLKYNGYREVRLVVGRYQSVVRGFHVWVTFMNENSEDIYLLDPTAQKRIWRASDFSEGSYKPLFSFDGMNRYRHDN